MNKKEQAIAWIKEEIRSLERAPELNGCPMTPEWAEQLEIMRTCLEAVQLSDFAEVSKQAEREYYAGFSSNTADIDREAWDPCAVCSVQHRDWGEYQYGYCPYCGRPLTEEAWAELEKRLMG